MPHDANKWDAWLTSSGQKQIEHFLRDGYLARQRWFGSKSRTISAVHLVDRCWFTTNTGPVLLACAEVRFTGGQSESYWTLLCVELGSAAAVPSDAVDDPETGRTLLRLLGSQSVAATAWGVLQGVALKPLDPDIERLPITRSQAEQSNTNLRIGDQYVLKLFRRAVPGLNPDYEIGRFLLEKTSFRHVPPLIGAIIYQGPDQEPMVLAMLQGWVANQGDGWAYALGRVREALEGRAVSGAGGWLQDASLLGRRTAELHRALASAADDPTFRPEPLTAADFTALQTRMRANLDTGMSLLRERPLPPAVQSLAAQILLKQDVLERRLAAALPQPLPQNIRCHGDYHLGQVLRTQNDFVILDFEGEPSRPLEERRAKQSPLKDVAGMLRSFSYAATAGLFQPQDRADDEMKSIALAWEQQTASAFLEAYRKTAGDAPFLPRDERQFKALLDLFVLDKALYELLYELNNRPDWVSIPLRGIAELIGDS